MDEGKVIHCNQSILLNHLIALLLFPIMLGVFWSFELKNPSKDGIITLSIITLFVGLCLCCIFLSKNKLSKQKYVFYESGVACYEKKQLITFERYCDFIFVEFYRKRHTTKRHSYSEYCLAFWCLDGTYIELCIKKSEKELKRVWEEILLNCPSLKDQLACYMVDVERDRLYRMLKNDSY